MTARSRIAALCVHNFRLLRRDPGPLVAMTVIPIGLMAFLAPSHQYALAQIGHPGANGSEQTVPGMVIMFAFFWHAYAGVGFFQEYNWGTWQRLQASPSRPIELIAGKVLPPFILAVIQLSVLIAAGAVLVDLEVRTAAVPAFAVLVVALAAAAIGLSVALAAVSRTFEQANTAGNIGAIVLAGLGGALVPVDVLPGWAQAIAPVTPSYWASRGFESVILDGHGVEATLIPAAVMLGFACAFAVAGVIGMRRTEGGGARARPRRRDV